MSVSVESSVEKQLAVHQLAVKKLDSNSWFVAARKLCIMYRLLFSSFFSG